MSRSHRQDAYRVRFDWGRDGAAAVADGADIAVVVDVLSFTTTLSVALDRGISVLPYRWNDDKAERFAERHGAVLAVGRAAKAGVRISLSPASIRAHPTPPERLVLPSPNGSSIAHYLSRTGVICIGACLRNAHAAAAWLDKELDNKVAVIAAGEHWPTGGLRPAVEDAWGAGAVISELVQLGWRDLSPEAEFARATYESIRGKEFDALMQCASGGELIELGYRIDVEIAAEINQSSIVGQLLDGAFIAGRDE